MMSDFISRLNLFAVSSILIFFSNLTISILAFLKGQDKRLSIVFGLLCLCVTTWGIGGYISSTTTSKEIAYLGWQIANICSVFVSPIYFHLVCIYTKTARKHLLLLMYFCGFVFISFNFFAKEMFLGDLQLLFNQFYYISWSVDKNLIYLIFYICFYWIFLLYSFYILVRNFLNSSKKKRNEIKYFLIGTSIGWLGAHGDFLSVFKPTFYPYLNFLIAIYPIILTYAIFKHQLMDIKIVLRKGLVYSILIAFITIIYLLVVLLFEKLLQGIVGYQSIFTSILTALIIALIFIPLKNKIQNFVDMVFFQGTFTQIAKEKELISEELNRSERLKSVATFASGMAHEIKNPLTAIKTFTEYLPEKKNDPEFLDKFSKIVSGEVGRIDSLVHQLLDFAKPSLPKLIPVNIHTLLEETLSFLNNQLIKHKIKVKKELRATQFTIQADLNQLKQAFLNIFLNAIDAMPNGGSFDIKTTAINSQTADKQFIQIIISDTGCGIRKKDLPHIFEPFYTAKDGGAGLGLSITHEIIKNHDGKILVESNTNKGTTFIIELPLKSNNY